MCLFLPSQQNIVIGKLGKINFNRGYYLYIGKSFSKSGVFSRIKRHLLKDTCKRWHIDYLKEYTEFKFVGIIENIDCECYLAKILNEKFVKIKKFGSSDCKCDSHLFYNNKWQEFIEYIKKAGIKPRFLFNINWYLFRFCFFFLWNFYC